MGRKRYIVFAVEFFLRESGNVPPDLQAEIMAACYEERSHRLQAIRDREKFMANEWRDQGPEMMLAIYRNGGSITQEMVKILDGILTKKNEVNPLAGSLAEDEIDANRDISLFLKRKAELLREN